MAKTSLIVKQQRLKNRFILAKKEGIKISGFTKYYNRCGLCGREGSYMREYDMCRCCFVKNARLGLIMGVKKSSW